jgi:hypothetical protein
MTLIDGVRITESGDRRITQASDRRITENFVGGETYEETLGLSSSMSVAVIQSLIRNAGASFVGSLAQLSASTVTRGVAATLTAQGSLTGLADRAQNLIAPLAGAGSSSAKLGYSFTVSSSQASSGALASVPQIIRNASASGSASSSFSSIAARIVNAGSSLSSSGAITALGLNQLAGNFGGSSSGTIGGAAAVTRNAGAGLIGSSTAIIFPQFIQGMIALKGSNAAVSADADVYTDIDSSLTSFGNLNGILEMVYSVEVVAGSSLRITEGGDTRITEDGDFRFTAGDNSTGNSQISAVGTLIPFAEGLFAKNDDTWKEVSPLVYRNGEWVTPRVYVKNDNIWKRVY